MIPEGEANKSRIQIDGVDFTIDLKACNLVLQLDCGDEFWALSLQRTSEGRTGAFVFLSAERSHFALDCSKVEYSSLFLSCVNPWTVGV